MQDHRPGKSLTPAEIVWVFPPPQPPPSEGISREVADDLWARHDRDCRSSSGPYPILVCFGVRAWCCSVCDQPLFFILSMDRWCAHAEELVDGDIPFFVWSS
jgi:hypothetical protein